LVLILFRDGAGREGPKEELDEALIILRTLQLRVTLFNIVLARILFLIKIVCLVCGILGGFAGLRLVHSNPALAFIYLLDSVECVGCYIALFSLAYKVTEVGEALDGEMEGVASRGVFLPRSARECLQRILLKTPQLAMSVGGFHTVERESIPRFVDFVLKQIVGLLVSF
jgi:hypothetical protein